MSSQEAETCLDRLGMRYLRESQAQSSRSQLVGYGVLKPRAGAWRLECPQLRELRLWTGPEGPTVGFGGSQEGSRQVADVWDRGGPLSVQSCPEAE